ncbi:hypothetical protein [Hymenobacter coccineus]|uniref:hypothetical protein n=1 Tax=Hymenobacter coccineus TaxID=1908235 RepID=UPI0013017897|nr:hypothetical protein [Hymenobacter coccineus]
MVGTLKPWHYAKTIQFTTAKATMDTFLGEASLDYKAEDGFVYIGPQEGSIKYNS